MLGDKLINLNRIGVFFGPHYKDSLLKVGWPFPTWRIIPVSKYSYIVTPISKPRKGHLVGEQPQSGDLRTMIINHLSKSWEPILQAYVTFPQLHTVTWTWDHPRFRSRFYREKSVNFFKDRHYLREARKKNRLCREVWMACLRERCFFWKLGSMR